MSIATAARAYVATPFPAFQPELTGQLVRAGWSELARRGLTDPAGYCVAACLGGQPAVYPGPVLSLPIGTEVRVELPDVRQFGAFYQAHGLADALAPAAELPAALPKLIAAFAVLAQVPVAGTCVGQLVRSLLVLRQPEAEIDLGYSHPAVPFSIFVSVCANDSPVASLRVAESILHEAMHLQLTLLEGILPLVRPDSTDTFYSPWRDEPRPIGGVLHGLYVFRIIHDFYQQLLELLPAASEERDFIHARQATIREEFGEAASFVSAPGLSVAGRQLARNLLDVVAA